MSKTESEQWEDTVEILERVAREAQENLNEAQVELARARAGERGVVVEPWTLGPLLERPTEYLELKAIQDDEGVVRLMDGERLHATWRDEVWTLEERDEASNDVSILGGEGE